MIWSGGNTCIRQSQAKNSQQKHWGMQCAEYCGKKIVSFSFQF